MALSMNMRTMRVATRSAPKTFRASPVQMRAPVVCRASAVDEIVEKLKTLTLIEASELVSMIETTFGVDASAAAAAPVAMMAAAGPAAAPIIEEKTTFDLVLNEIPADKKVSIYKVIRVVAGIAVNQVKDFTATLPKTVKEGISKAEVEDFKKQMEDAGAKCSIL
jgi:large subunit ribosomal protein L7/L12